MMKAVIVRLEYLCDLIPGLLEKMDEATLTYKPNPERWSKKEIIGHLIDSATNNHQCFVRGQFEDSPAIYYDQNKWNEYSFYQLISSKQLINFWRFYNLHLAEIIKNIAPEIMPRTCTMKDGSQLSLEFLVVDYLIHLEHHLHQITDYK